MQSKVRSQASGVIHLRFAAMKAFVAEGKLMTRDLAAEGERASTSSLLAGLESRPEEALLC